MVWPQSHKTWPLLPTVKPTQLCTVIIKGTRQRQISVGVRKIKTEMAHSKLLISLALLALATAVTSHRGRNGGRCTQSSCDGVTCAVGQMCEVQSGRARCVRATSCDDVTCPEGLECSVRSGRTGGVECTVSCDDVTCPLIHECEEQAEAEDYPVLSMCPSLGLSLQLSLHQCYMQWDQWAWSHRQEVGSGACLALHLTQPSTGWHHTCQRPLPRWAELCSARRAERWGVCVGFRSFWQYWTVYYNSAELSFTQVVVVTTLLQRDWQALLAAGYWVPLFGVSEWSVCSEWLMVS